MAKKGKLLAALDAHRGRDYEKERQKKMLKQAEKKNKSLNGQKESLHDHSDEEDGSTHPNGVSNKAASELGVGSESSEEESLLGLDDVSEADEGSEDDNGVQLGEDLDEDDIEDGDEGSEDEEEEEDIPMSDIEDLDPEDREDIIPHQRLTINNTTALLKAHRSIALPSSLPFSATQAVTSDTQTSIADVHDDLTRELAFYKQSLDAAVEGRARLRREGVAFSRPPDFFAEMVKTDEHMGRVRARIVDQAAGKKAAADARRQRDLKKFGKQVQVARLQERDRQKRDALDRISLLKRKRKDAGPGPGDAANEEDLFDVALDNETGGARGGGGGPRSREKGAKRAKKDAKFGFGGKKRFAKSNDAASSSDMRGFSSKKMKAGGGKRGSAPRPGKSKRAKRF